MGVSSHKVKLFAGLVLSLLLLGCSREPPQENILKSMAELDRVHIPTLIFTNLHRQRESEIAMERLSREWQKFKQKYYHLEFKYGLDITDKFWKEDFDRIDLFLTTAEVFIGERKLAEAHEELERVRFVFRELRKRNGLDYFLDGMTEFHEPMEQIILTLRGKDNISEEDLFRLEALFREAWGSWERVAAAEIDPEVFGFDPEKMEAIKERIKEEQSLLENFAAALSARNADQIFQGATDLRPNFVVLYKAFGDFQPIFGKIIEERKASVSGEVEGAEEKEVK